MKQKWKNYVETISQSTVLSSLTFTLLLGYLFGKWSTQAHDLTEVSVDTSLPKVVAQGETIEFPEKSPALNLIQSISLTKSNATLSMTAPARVFVANIANSKKGGPSSLLFENPDTTSLFSQFRQAKANYSRTEQNLSRMKDMYKNQAATGKELNDAQNDFAVAKATFNEFDSKLRSSGIDPIHLDQMKTNTVWVISEIPESQVSEIEKGETVRLTFAFKPDHVYVGHADSIGEGVDPSTRTIKVIIEIPNAEGELKPGMFAKADFGAFRNATLVVPASSLVHFEDRDYVFVQAGERQFKRREVVVSPADNDQFLVTKGLDADDKIVSTGTMLLKGLSFQF